MYQEKILSERFGETRVITCCVVDCRLKFLQRIMSSVVDSRRKPRAMKISSVVQDSRRCGACTAEGATDCCGSETPATRYSLDGAQMIVRSLSSFSRKK